MATVKQQSEIIPTQTQPEEIQSEDEEQKIYGGLGLRKSKRLMNFDGLQGNLSQSGRDHTDGSSSMVSMPSLFAKQKSGLQDLSKFGQALFAKNGYTQSGNQFQTNLCDVHNTSESLGITSDKIADE